MLYLEIEYNGLRSASMLSVWRLQ